LLLGTCALVGVMAMLAWDSSYIANDGVQYLSTATNWLNGDGFSTSALIYSSHFQGQIPAVQTIWPPGYPWMIAVAKLSGMELHQAALMLNLIGHALASALVYLVLRRLNVQQGFAIASACLFYLTAIPWQYTLGLVTEPIFTLLTLGILLFLPRSEQMQWHRFLLCGLLAAAAVYIRFSAILFAFSVGLIYLCITLARTNYSVNDLISGFGKLLLVSTPPVLALLQLMLRNKELTGKLQRETGFDSPDTLIATLKLWIGHSSDLLGFSAGGLFNHTVGLLLYVLLASIVVLIAANGIRLMMSRSAPKTVVRHLSYHAVVFSVILAHTVTFVAYLSYCNLTDSPLRITTRYSYQIYPGLFVLVCTLIWITWKSVKEKNSAKSYTAVQTGIGILIVAFLAGQLNEALAPPRFILKAKFVKSAMSLPVNEAQTLGEFIDRCFNSEPNNNNSPATIWSSHGQQMLLNTGVPTLTRTEVYANQTLDFDELEEQINLYNIGLFIFFDESGYLSDEHLAAMDSIKQWLPKNGHQQLSLENNLASYNTTVTVYTVNNQCQTFL